MNKVSKKVFYDFIILNMLQSMSFEENRKSCHSIHEYGYKNIEGECVASYITSSWSEETQYYIKDANEQP